MHPDYHFSRADTPYNGPGSRIWSGDDEFPDVSRPLGVQCNLCVDEYTEENGGTMFVPSSFQRARQPPPEFKDSDFVPPDGAQMLAPAGTLLMYHAATYHRLHVNVSGRPRIGVLQSFVRIPRHVFVDSMHHKLMPRQGLTQPVG